MTALVDSSVTSPFDGYEESSLFKRPMYTIPHHSEFAFHRFSLFREKNILTDAVISSSDDKMFNVHSIVMAAKSDYFFNKLFNAEHHEILTDYTAFAIAYEVNIDSDGLESIIGFCYSGCIELTEANVENILLGAKALQMDSLIMLCNEMMVKTLDASNCIRFLEIADRQHLGFMKESAIELIAEHLPYVNRLPEFQHLDGSQMFWLIELLSNCENGNIFDELLQSLSAAENAISLLKPGASVGDETRNAIRTAFIAGYFQGSINASSFCQSSIYHVESTAVLLDSVHDEIEHRTFNTNQSVQTEKTPPVHVLSLLKRRTLQFFTFIDIEQRWETTRKVDLTHPIESFRDAIMITIKGHLVIFHMRKGSISQAQNLSLDSFAVENINCSNGADCAELALFCMLNDEIYCFARTDQQFFHKFNPSTNVWSNGQIDGVLDAKYIVGLNNEIYFIGCGYERTSVRSYHLEHKQWTDRGNLRHENKDTCIKAAAMNGSIFVVMSCFDSSKIYNGTEFHVQRYDANVDDWVIIRKIYYSHFVDYFHLDVCDGCLYIFYGDGEVTVYSEDDHDWKKIPAIDYNVLDVSLCMIARDESLQLNSSSF